MRDLGAGWRVRCTHCDKSCDASDAGVARIGAFSIGKCTLGWCTSCRSMRILSIERMPETAAEPN